MPTAKKAAVIEELTDKLGRINAAALIEYRGLNVAEISDLRNQLRRREIELQVTKNTLLREAAHRNNMENLDDLFEGPTAVAFIYGDESTGTKALNDYFRTARVGAIKSGILRGGRRVTAEQFVRLADLPNRETLLARSPGCWSRRCPNWPRCSTPQRSSLPTLSPRWRTKAALGAGSPLRQQQHRRRRPQRREPRRKPRPAEAPAVEGSAAAPETASAEAAPEAAAAPQAEEAAPAEAIATRHDRGAAAGLQRR